MGSSCFVGGTSLGEDSSVMEKDGGIFTRQCDCT